MIIRKEAATGRRQCDDFRWRKSRSKETWKQGVGIGLKKDQLLELHICLLKPLLWF
jgi:hypothetical protein